ncbi:hypothetical protein [Streptomyces luteireticuli]|uniref:hypothetical protein n=1 Tax=Streptomyces luteireticuli TaxID=173858 RepID=UPI003558330B
MRAALALRGQGVGMAYVMVEENLPARRGGRRPPGGMVSAALGAGLRPVALGRQTIHRVPTWRASYREGCFTAGSSGLPRPFVGPMPLPIPPGWCETARSAGVMVLFVADDLGLGLPEGPEPADDFEGLAAAAGRGALAAGAIPFTMERPEESVRGLVRQAGTPVP